MERGVYGGGGIEEKGEEGGGVQGEDETENGKGDEEYIKKINKL